MKDENIPVIKYLFSLSIHHNNPKAYTDDIVKRTTREIEIIRCVARGLTNHKITKKLFLNSVTVTTHRKNILARFNLKNTVSLIKYAADNKLL